ncbi:hypothetical protein ECANGB1_2156 [Enterospora canceri]|uniref:Uncharacterized protein n=1 Tax=Enterospora canceri TaxID=1081671 RepID=A0A1Y1S520_9MICR|nr:hypothetical protein ECANGB1_2156 [Enterospora canceri]
MSANIKHFVNSNFIKKMFNECNISEEDPVITKNYAVEMRDAFITYFIVMNIRRSKELTSVTLGEFNNATLVRNKNGDSRYVVRIHVHKTQQQGKNISIYHNELIHLLFSILYRIFVLFP